MNLRDQIGADRLNKLSTASQPEAIIRWFLIAQITIADALARSSLCDPLHASEGATFAGSRCR